MLHTGQHSNCALCDAARIVQAAPAAPDAKEADAKPDTRPTAPAEMIRTVEEQWRRRSKSFGLKRGTKRYHDAECHFFCGAMATIDALGYVMPPGWYISAMCGRPIVDG